MDHQGRKVRHFVRLIRAEEEYETIAYTPMKLLHHWPREDAIGSHNTPNPMPRQGLRQALAEF
jgi:hypothetical protein